MTLSLSLPLTFSLSLSFYDSLIAFIVNFQNMYGYRGLWSLRAEKMIIFEVTKDGQT